MIERESNIASPDAAVPRTELAARNLARMLMLEHLIIEGLHHENSLRRPATAWTTPPVAPVPNGRSLDMPTIVTVSGEKLRALSMRQTARAIIERSRQEWMGNDHAERRMPGRVPGSFGQTYPATE